MSIFESVLSGFFFKRIYKSVLYENDEDFEKKYRGFIRKSKRHIDLLYIRFIIE